MAQPAGQTAQPVQSTSVYDTFKPYESGAVVGCLATAVGTLINPIAGAAIGVYFVTNIGSTIVANHFKVGQTNPVARMVAIAAISLASIGAAFATVCAIKGSIVILTPAVIAVGISLVCFSVLGSICSE